MTPVLAGPLSRHLVSSLPTRRLIVDPILEEISPLPAREENPGLGIPMEMIVTRFLCVLLLAVSIPVPPSQFLPLTQVPRAWATVVWKFVRRALLLCRGTPPAK